MDDLISKHGALDALKKCRKHCCREDKVGDKWIHYETALNEIECLPSVEPEIIYCKDCVKHNKRIGDYVEKSDGTYDWIWKDQACPLAEFRGKAQGHEFDYQFCAYAERRTE